MKNSLYVMQKHHSSTIHYDFRIQIGNILKSWVIPKGPSVNPKDKRLAILTEDHALDFANFEGKIPTGQYGAGKIIVWDRGSYQNISTKNGVQLPIEKAFENGEIIISIKGEKLNGIFSLILMKNQTEPKNWLIIKQKDQYADNEFDPIVELPNSIISQKSVEEI